MNKKVLIVATSDIHLQVFHIPYFEMLKKKGCTIEVAVEIRGSGMVPFTDKVYNVPFKRTLFTPKLFSAYKQLKQIIDSGNYDLIHCHTPIPSALTRLAAQSARKKGTVVMYTSHGFHFYKGGPKSSWLLYYNIEKLLSRKTDVLITINKEDYEVAKNEFSAKENFYMRGIGVDTSRFNPIDSSLKPDQKIASGYAPDSFILFYAANFIARKNHIFLLKALIELKKHIPEVKIVFAGSGVLLQQMKDFCIANNLQNEVEFPGFVKDVNKFLAVADVSVSASKHEGLGLALAEAMYCGVPVVASVDRGHKEMIDHEVNGFLFEQENQEQFVNYILKLYNDNQLAKTFVDKSIEKVKEFSIENSLRFMQNVYTKYLNK